jgi:hypothetical protein
VPTDDQRPRKPRAQTATDRDLASPHLGLRPRAGEVESLADESDSDGTPIAKQGPDQSITPKPHDIANEPSLNQLWDHVDSYGRRSAKHVMDVLDSIGASQSARERIAELEAHIDDHRGTLRVVKLVGTIATLVFGVVGGIAIKTIFAAGENNGTVNTTLIYMQRQIEGNALRIQENNAEFRHMVEKIEDKLDDHVRFHSTRGSRSAAPPTSPAPSPGDLND